MIAGRGDESRDHRNMSQFDLFSQPVEQLSPAPSVDSVRARLEALLASMRVAETLPLTNKQLAFWTVVVPQMTNWLPDDEKSRICGEFDSHIARLVPRAA